MKTMFDGSRTVMPKKNRIPPIPPPGREPTPQYLRSVWATDYIPDWARPAKRQAIASAEKRLGVAIPKVLKDQLAVQNGGQIFLSEMGVPFEDTCRHWTNAIVDGVMPVEEWEIAAENHWFQNASDVPHLKSLVIIAAHSESQLCLDFRACGPKRIPAVVYIDVCMQPTSVATICPTVTEFLAALISSKEVGE
jgi:hypothetical protein